MIQKYLQIIFILFLTIENIAARNANDVYYIDKIFYDPTYDKAIYTGLSLGVVEASLSKEVFKTSTDDFTSSGDKIFSENFFISNLFVGYSFNSSLALEFASSTLTSSSKTFNHTDLVWAANNKKLKTTGKLSINLYSIDFLYREIIEEYMIPDVILGLGFGNAQMKKEISYFADDVFVETKKITRDSLFLGVTIGLENVWDNGFGLRGYSKYRAYDDLPGIDNDLSLNIGVIKYF
jgi:hypothetical protein